MRNGERRNAETYGRMIIEHPEAVSVERRETLRTVSVLPDEATDPTVRTARPTSVVLDFQVQS